MKKSVFHIALFLGLLLSQTAISQEKISLRVPNFVRPLVEKWASDYQKSHTNVDFQFVSGKSQDNNSNTLSLATDAEAVSFARFAVLPDAYGTHRRCPHLYGGRLACGAGNCFHLRSYPSKEDVRFKGVDLPADLRYPRHLGRHLFLLPSHSFRFDDHLARRRADRRFLYPVRFFDDFLKSGKEITATEPTAYAKSVSLKSNSKQQTGFVLSLPV